MYLTFAALGGDELAQMMLVRWNTKKSIEIFMSLNCSFYTLVTTHLTSRELFLKGYRYWFGVGVEVSCETSLTYYKKVATKGMEFQLDHT